MNSFFFFVYFTGSDLYVNQQVLIPIVRFQYIVERGLNMILTNNRFLVDNDLGSKSN